MRASTDVENLAPGKFRCGLGTERGRRRGCREAGFHTLGTYIMPNHRLALGGAVAKYSYEQVRAALLQRAERLAKVEEMHAEDF